MGAIVTKLIPLPPWMGNILSLQCILTTQAKEKKLKKIGKAILIPFAWGLFLSLQINKSAAEIFRTSGPFLLQKGCNKQDNLFHNGESWCASTATTVEHPTKIHVQERRPVASHALCLPFHPSSAGKILPLEVGKRQCSFRSCAHHLQQTVRKGNGIRSCDALNTQIFL